MKIYKLSSYIMDDFTRSHLEKWLESAIRYDEIDDVRNKILIWIQNSDPTDVEYALNDGWRKVYELARGEI
jgi:hypothetical protein